MKKQIWMMLLLAPLAGRAQDYRLTVKLGALKTPAEAYLVYEYGMTDEKVLDSAGSANGVFSFSGLVDDPPVKATLVVNHAGPGWSKLGRDADTRGLYLEKGDILLQGVDSGKNTIAIGSPLNADYDRYYTFVLAPGENFITAGNEEYRTASVARQKSILDSLMAQLREMMTERDSLRAVYISRNPGSYFSLLALKDLAGSNINVPRIEPLFKGLSDSLRNSKQGQGLAAAIESARFTSIGAIAPDFTEDDPDGHPVKLSDFRGKYVLLDFWASWCGPCRAENPNVVKAYGQYHAKGFEVLSVSLDGPGKKAAWLSAVQKDSLSWTQVSDLQFWNNAAAKLYSIKSIPQNFLIDPTGKIVGRNLRGDDLQKRLSELL